MKMLHALKCIAKRILPHKLWTCLHLLKAGGFKAVRSVLEEKRWIRSLCANDPKRFDAMVEKFFRNETPLSASLADSLPRWKRYQFLKSRFCRVLDALPNYAMSEPFEKPKIIWWLWAQGEENAPALCRAGLNSIRRQYPRGGV